MINLKQTGKQILYGLLYICFIYFIITYFNLGFWATYGVLVVGATVMYLYTKTFKLYKWFKSIIIIFLFLALVRFLSRLIGGVWGFILIVSILVIYKLISRRKQFIKGKQDVESMIWGKPLKEYISKGERPPKIKIVK